MPLLRVARLFSPAMLDQWQRARFWEDPLISSNCSAISLSIVADSIAAAGRGFSLATWGRQAWARAWDPLGAIGDANSVILDAIVAWEAQGRALARDV